jgi:hypothetical protein
VRLVKGINKNTGGDLLGHIAIVETRNLVLRTSENYLDSSTYFNVQPNPRNILLKYCRQTEGEFNIIHGVPLDPMHTVFHVALTWLVDAVWIQGKISTKEHKGKFSPKLMAFIESRLKRLKGCFPYAIQTELGSKPFAKFGSLWSCSMKRIWLIYVAPIILKHPLMEPQAYMILLSFSHAIMLLLGSGHLHTVSETHLRKAQENLLYVIEKSQKLYGKDFPRYVFHCLLHIVDDLRANRCRLDYCSMFKYENSMRFFAHVLDRRGGHRMHAQLRNALLRKRHSNIMLPPM